MHHRKILGILAVMIFLISPVLGEEIRWNSDTPVFGEWIGGPKAYYPSVVYDPDRFSGHGIASKYKMWYGTSGAQTGLAVSDDGVHWTDIGVVMTDGYHATVEYYSDGFPGANRGDNPNDSFMYYRMWYWDYPSLYSVSAIGYAESPDGVHWYNYQSLQNGTVPIITGTWPDWNRGSYGPCDVLYNPGASNTGSNPFDYTFVMYYDGTTGGVESIGLGYSSDGIVWNGYDADGDGKADPVFEGTYTPGDWDYDFVSRATIINTGREYEMWYSGGIGGMNNGIGYAVSFDGIHWERDVNNPVLHREDGTPWREERTYCPMVIREGNLYMMWFTGKGESKYSIGYVTGEALSENSQISLFIEKLFGINILNVNSEGTFAVENGKEIGKLSLGRGTYTVEIDIFNTGILKAYGVKLEIEAPEGIKFEISPEKSDIERKSMQTFTITLNITDAISSGDYLLRIKATGNFVSDSTYIKIHVE